MAELHEGTDFALLVARKVIQLTGYDPSHDIEIGFSMKFFPSAFDELIPELDPPDNLVGALSFRQTRNIHNQMHQHRLARGEARFMRKVLFDGTLSTYRSNRVFFKPFSSDEADDLFDIMAGLEDHGIDLDRPNSINVMLPQIFQLSKLTIDNGNISVADYDRAHDSTTRINIKDGTVRRQDEWSKPYQIARFRAWAKSQIQIGYWHQTDPLATERPGDSHAWLKLFRLAMKELPAKDRLWLTAILRRLRANQTARMEKARQGWRLVGDDDIWYRQLRKEILGNTDIASWLERVLKEL